MKKRAEVVLKSVSPSLSAQRKSCSSIVLLSLRCKYSSRGACQFSASESERVSR